MNLKSIVKKGIATSLTFMSVLMLTSISQVQASSNSEIGSLELLKGELVMENFVVSEMTNDELIKLESGEIAAIEFDTMEEFQEYLHQRKAQTIDITSNINDTTIETYGLSDVSDRVIGVDPIPLPPVYINSQFSYPSKKDTSGLWAFTSITYINSWLTGIQFTVNYSWDQKSGTYSYSNSKRNVKITVSGVIGTHLIIEGIGHILDQNTSYSFDYLARKL